MRISGTFRELRTKKEGALIAYVCAGDGDTPGIVHALVRGGADIVELGLPFSDPVADGPTIQASIQRALDAGMNPDKYFAMVRNLDVDVPLVVMTYYNLIFKRGYCEKNGVDLIFLVAPTTEGSRLEDILKRGTGFLYLVSRLGVTGARADVALSTKEVLDRVKTDTPRAVGFGISSGKQAASVFKNGADGVIVGSAFVDIIASGRDVTGRLEALASELKSSMQ
ncbi:MAG: tryptophan synthase subunit alpha [ANME-2 cluster archaeon]|nr:tryptophan synthase subunit alpha [ANME-2 cluster archaeon]